MSEKKNKEELKQLDEKMNSKIAGGEIYLNPDTGLYDVYNNESGEYVRSYSDIGRATQEELRINHRRNS